MTLDNLSWTLTSNSTERLNLSLLAHHQSHPYATFHPYGRWKVTTTPMPTSR